MGSDDDPADATKRIRRQLHSISEHFANRLTLNLLRPLPLFMGINPTNSCINPTAFSLPFGNASHSVNPNPANHKNLAATINIRLSKNLSFFFTNYVFIFFITLLVVSLSHPLTLLYCTGLGAVWFAHSKTLELENQSASNSNSNLPQNTDPVTTKIQQALIQLSKPVTIGSVNIQSGILPPIRRTFLLLLLTVYVGIFHALYPVLSVICISGVICGVHASVRDLKVNEYSRVGGSEEDEGEDDEADKFGA